MRPETVDCYAIKRSDKRGIYFTESYKWGPGLHNAKLYRLWRDARAMAERRGAPCEIVKIKIQEV